MPVVVAVSHDDDADSPTTTSRHYVQYAHMLTYHDIGLREIGAVRAISRENDMLGIKLWPQEPLFASLSREVFLTKIAKGAPQVCQDEDNVLQVLFHVRLVARRLIY